MEKRRTSFVFYEGFYEAIQELETAEEKVELLDAICSYEFTGEVPEMSYACRVAFKVIRRSLDSAMKRYNASVENGKKGGRPKKSDNLEKPNETYDNLGKPTEPNETYDNLQEPTSNLNESVSDSVSESVSDNNIEETSSSTKKKSSSTNSSSKRKPRKEQLEEYVQATSFADETKDILYQWIFTIGLEGGVTVEQLRDKLKNIWESCNGNESLVREAIKDAYLNNWFGFYPPKKQANFSEKKSSSHLTLDKNKNPAQPNAQVVQPRKQGCWDMN